MALTVQTPYLRGFAAQIDADRDGALAAVAAYCQRFCTDTEGLDGLLTPARAMVDSNTKLFVELMESAGHGLRLTAYDLRQTADSYDRSDAAAADRLWTAGRTWELPRDYREHDVAVVSSGFSHGATVNLVVPEERHDAQDAKASVISSLWWVNRIVTWVTGTDLLAQAMPIVFSEWGILRRIAQAHDEMERGFDLIAQDLSDGMDTLSAHWTGDAGTASAAFDYHLRQRWVRGFRALANASNAAQQTYEWMANAYEYIVNVFLIALNFYAQRIKKAIKGLTAVNPAVQAFALFQLVTGVVQLIADTVRAIYLQTKMFVSGCEMMVANLTSLVELFRGDLDVLRQA